MKTLLITLIIIAVLFIFFQTYITMSTNKTESQKYEVIKSDNDFEIRLYPAVTMASIESNAKSYKELGSNGFRKLASYIFGGNQSNKQISMTTPVHMNISDESSTMSFVMPSEYNKDNLPKPNDIGINIITAPKEYVAAIKFDGFASDKDIQYYSSKLAFALSERDIQYQGHFRFLGYNPPYQFVGRRNEVIVTIEKPH